jgi:nucleoid DNA-binding protein
MKIDKLGLIKLLSKKTDRTQIESKIFLDALSDIFEEIIKNGDTLLVPGLGKLYVKNIPEKTMLEPNGARKIFIKAGKRAVFKVSENWKKK